MALEKKRSLTTTQIIMFGFLGAIVVGTLLLALPIASSNGKATNLLDSLFTATTSVCVTGLVVVPTWSHWSLFGQAVIALLIQVGGLGVITFTTLVLMVMGRRITLKERLLIQDAYNLDSIRGVVKLTLRILKGVLRVEAIGAVFYSLVFIPRYGIAQGIWKSIFNSVSAFCNAGMDILGDTSLQPFQGNVIINFTTMALIILGGLGFPVWWNILDVLKERKRRYDGWRTAVHHFTLQTKVVISVTVFLIGIGALFVFLLEYNNPDTIGNMPLWEKIMASLFQSVTTRTAGFLTIPQENLRNATALVCIILMFIGGSPSGTAGGVKTTTLGIMLLAVFSIVRGHKDTEAFGRKISTSLVKKAMAVFSLSLAVAFFSIITLLVVQEGDFLDLLYECISAIGTVGLSRAVTGNLNDLGKIVIIITMYAGRVGPISLALFFNSRKYINVRSYPKENISVG